MKKKVLAAFLATAMVCGLLTGCHDSSKNEATIDIKKTSFTIQKKKSKNFEIRRKLNADRKGLCN